MAFGYLFDFIMKVKLGAYSKYDILRSDVRKLEWDASIFRGNAEIQIRQDDKGFSISDTKLIRLRNAVFLHFAVEGAAGYLKGF